MGENWSFQEMEVRKRMKKEIQRVEVLVVEMETEEEVMKMIRSKIYRKS